MRIGTTSRRGARNAFGIGILIAVGGGAYLLLSDRDSETDYRSAVHRFGQSTIERLVTATLPPAMAAQCIDRYGEDQALVDAVIAYNLRTETEQRTLIADLEAIGTMATDERRAVEDRAMAVAAARLPDQAACAEAASDIASGALDLPGTGAADAHAEGN